MKKYLLFENSADAQQFVPEGQKRLVKAGGRMICLIRKNGNLIAFNNACPHSGHPLHEGFLNFQSEIVCASHAYRFHLLTGNESDNRCASLRFIKVLEEDKVYLEF